jgi:hypothetical protein
MRFTGESGSLSDYPLTRSSHARDGAFYNGKQTVTRSQTKTSGDRSLDGSAVVYSSITSALAYSVDLWQRLPKFR